MTPAAKLPLASMTLAANLAMSTAGVVDTGGKFATCVNDTSQYNNGNNIRLITP
jgi:hypothetical protein